MVGRQLAVQSVGLAGVVVEIRQCTVEQVGRNKRKAFGRVVFGGVDGVEIAGVGANEQGYVRFAFAAGDVGAGAVGQHQWLAVQWVFHFPAGIAIGRIRIDARQPQQEVGFVVVAKVTECIEVIQVGIV